jgi:hypothetical protein
VFVQVFCHLADSILDGHVSSIPIDFVECVNRISMVEVVFFIIPISYLFNGVCEPDKHG